MNHQTFARPASQIVDGWGGTCQAHCLAHRVIVRAQRDLFGVIFLKVRNTPVNRRGNLVVSFLKSAFLASAVSESDFGLNITDAFMDAFGIAHFPHRVRLSVAGEYQYDVGEETKLHVYALECLAPSGGPPLSLGPSSFELPPGTLNRVGETVVPHVFYYPLAVELPEPGIYAVALTVDGEQVARLRFEAIHMSSTRVDDGALREVLGDSSVPELGPRHANG